MYESPLQKFLATKRWTAFRFFVIPVCVSSSSALANARAVDFAYIFPTDSNGGTIGIAASLLVGVIAVLNGLRFVATRPH